MTIEKKIVISQNLMWFSQNPTIKQSAQEDDSPKKANYTQLNR